MTHWRATVSGALPAGDIWVTGVDLFRVSGGDTPGALTSWTTAWDLAWNGTGASDDIKSLVKTTVTATLLTVTQVDSAGKNIDQAVGTVALAGTATDDSMPGETSPVVTMRTANASKGGRGRRFWPCLTEASNAGNGELVSGSQTQLAKAAQAMVQSLNGDSYQVVVWHRFSATGDAVTAIDVANLFRVQRRRQNRVAVSRVRMSV